MPQILILILLFILLFVLVIFLFIYVSHLFSIFASGPYVPLRKKIVERALNLAEILPGEIVYDLGSGDGRVLIGAVEKFGAQARGIEISPWPYLKSLLKVKFKGLSPEIKIKYGNLFKIDLKEADIVFCYLMPKAMPQLAEKLKRELKKGTRVVASAFSFPNWLPSRIDQPKTKGTPIYLYKI